jgi:hypothetical protein
VVMFCYILWESIAAQRLLLWVVSPSSQQEWGLKDLPVSFHEFERGVWFHSLPQKSY